MKKLLSLVLAFVIVLSLVPATVFAASDIVITNLSIDDVQLYEGANYGANNTYVFYPSGTATSQDGTSFDFEGGGFGVYEEYFEVKTNAAELQSIEPWVCGGTYEVTCTMEDVSTTCKVTIVESPIVSFEVEDVVVYENMNGYQLSDHFYYEVPVKVKYTLNDGRVLETLEGSGIDSTQFSFYQRSFVMQEIQAWSVGNTYKVPATLNTLSTTFNVTVAPNPVAELQLIKKPEKTTYLAGEYLDLKGTTLRLMYTDGTYEDFTIQGTPLDEYSIYSERLQLYDTFDASSVMYDDMKSVKIELFNVSCTIPVTVKENLIKSVSAQETADKNLVVTIYNTDNTSYQLTVYDYIDGYGGSKLLTDKGIFVGMIGEIEDNTCRVWMGDPNTNGWIRSNLIENAQFVQAWQIASEASVYIASYYAEDSFTYNGKITAENIDMVIEMATSVAYREEDDIVSSNQSKTVVRAAFVRNVLKERLGNVTVDLNLSKLYNAKEDTYTFLRRWYTQVYNKYPSRLSYSNGTWTVKYIYQNAAYEDADEIVIDMKLNDAYQFVSVTLGGENASIFKDISTTSWQYQAAQYAVEHNLMAGKGTDAQGNIVFDPNSSITREEFVQVLYNAEGKPTVNLANEFKDVKNAWYTNAVLWAKSQDIANGTPDGNFGIGKNITRQDLAMMLYKYAKLKGYTLAANAGEIDKYADGSKVSGYAKTAMDWAVTNGVLSGKGVKGEPLSKFKLDPAGTATRAECAAMLKNFMTAFGL